MPLILFNKPFQVMCQFSPHPTRKTLADFLDIPGIYPAGRLDADSEGLLLLTDDGKLQHRISHPDSKQPKTYIVQVEGIPDDDTLTRLREPLNLGDFVTQRCDVKQIEPPEWLWERNPPIRQRESSPTSWLAITLSEGKNRQVRRMTAAVGLPTLRLVRIAVGPFSLATHPLWPGDWREVSTAELEAGANAHRRTSSM
ncbi:MAG TPA: pseudouridine synthase [Noviherbaspirillum sp.]|uniref:pseudouridine synthase n=1 Tax=Noviherbaspirillum sp. TaxID=1926288 RepID=UPI002B492BBC|nr:pseudouridine synthase [Noviherbaspirillum sp.]HJV86815.1 pseudouridine synthase [Noviherbaspirillum sp.]